MEISIVLDALASFAATVAIVTALVSWARATRKPIALRRIVIHNKRASSADHIFLKNRREFPVSINEAAIFERKKYQVQRKVGGAPEYDEFLSSPVIINKPNPPFEMKPFGHDSLSIDSGSRAPSLKHAVLMLKTSHGYHEFRCKNLTDVEAGTSEVYKVAFRSEKRSKLLALVILTWRRMLYGLFRK